MAHTGLVAAPSRFRSVMVHPGYGNIQLSIGTPVQAHLHVEGGAAGGLGG